MNLLETYQCFTIFLYKSVLIFTGKGTISDNIFYKSLYKERFVKQDGSASVYSNVDRRILTLELALIFLDFRLVPGPYFLSYNLLKCTFLDRTIWTTFRYLCPSFKATRSHAPSFLVLPRGHFLKSPRPLFFSSINFYVK